MKNKFVTMLLAFISVICLAFGLSACGNNGGNGGNGGGNGDGDGTGGGDGGSGVTVSGTYYYCENDVLDQSLYITFKDGSWTDEENQSGEYTLSDSVVTLSITVATQKEEYASGYVSGDDITLYFMGEEWLYRKGDDIDPAKPKTKTLDLELSSDKKYYIVKGIGGLTGNVTIPDEYKNKPVKEIAENAFANSTVLTGITIGKNVTSVGKKAFYKCSNLTEVVLGESVTAIAESTFEECRKLESVTIPASVESIDKKAFYFCLALKDIYFTGTASDWAEIEFYYSKGYNTIEISNPLSDNNIYVVGNNTAYADHTSRNLYIDGELLTECEITDATGISPFAFYGYTALISATIGNSVAEIGEYAFYKCSELTTLQFNGAYLEKIYESAFDSCNKLQSVTLPDSVTRIEKYAFNSCSALSEVNTGSGAKYIGYGAFMSCESLSDLTLGSSVSEICEAAFYGCEYLASVSIPASVIFIGKDAFWGTRLISATFEVTEGWIANKDEELTSEQLSNTATAAILLTTSVLYQGYAETDWERQTLVYTLSSDQTYYTVNNYGTACRSEIVIPDTYKGKPVRALAERAFENCKSLVSITLPYCIMTIPANAFSGCTSLENIEVGYNLGGDFENVYASSDGVLYTADFSEIVYIPYAKTTLTINCETIPDRKFQNNTRLKEVILGDKVKSIGNYAFNGCDSLTSVIIGNGVTTIGESAFSSCYNLANVIIGDGVTSIGYYAFGYCLSIRSIVIPDSVTSIDKHAFRSCQNLTSITIGNGVTSIGEHAFSDCSSLKSIVIPASVTSIGEYTFSYCENLTSVTLGEGLTSIPRNMFDSCYSLASINIPTGVTSIEQYAFIFCYSLMSIVIPASVTSIGTGAFQNCGIIYCEVAEKPGDWEEYWSNGAVAVIWDCNNNDKNEDGYIYAEINGLLYSLKDGEATVVEQSQNISGSITVPANVLYQGTSYSVTEIGYKAFYGCRSITSLKIPASVTYIGNMAFYNCNNLIIYCEVAEKPSRWDLNWSMYAVSVVWDYKNNDKDNNGFAYAMIDGLRYSLKDGEATVMTQPVKFSGKLVIPASVTYKSAKYSVTTIAKSAFSGCKSLTDITIPDSVTSIGEYAFSECPIENAVIPALAAMYIINDKLKTVVITSGDSVPDQAFRIYNKNLKSVTIGDSVKEIGGYAFESCTALISVKLGSGLTDIGGSAFRGCTALQSITLGNNVESIGNYAFYGCTSLKSVTTSESLKTIGDYAFSGCQKLNGIILPDGLTSIGNFAFQSCKSLTSISLPGSITDMGGAVFYYCSALKSVTLSNDITSLPAYNNYGFFQECSSLTSIIIPDGVTTIESHTFSYCSSLASIVLSDNITSIGEYAFYQCGIRSITIGKNLKTINGTAFYGCPVNTVYYTGDIAGWCEIEGLRAFMRDGYGSYKNLTLYIDGEEVTGDIVIPDSVTEISDYAFCSLRNVTSVTIGKNVTSIGLQAFYYCNLTSIIFEGTTDQWLAIEKGDNWGPSAGNYTIQCTDGTVSSDGTVSKN